MFKIVSLIALAILSSFLVSGVISEDALALKKCTELHHIQAEPGSAYSNNNCQLVCIVNNGNIDVHMMNEGFPCPLADLGTCHLGKCVMGGGPQTNPPATTLPPTKLPPTTPTTPKIIPTIPTLPPTTPKPMNLGVIGIEVLGATFARPAEIHKGSLTVCITNSTTQFTLPISDHHSCTSSCNASLAITPTTAAIWNNPCSREAFTDLSSIYFEVFDIQGPTVERYLGGAALTIQQVIAHNDVGKSLKLVFNGTQLNSGYLDVLVNWLPKVH